MDPAGVVIIISLLKATGEKSKFSYQWGVTLSERKKEKNWLQSVEKGIGTDKEKVPPFIEVVPQQQPKDNHVSETDPEVLWFIEHIFILLSTQYYLFLKNDSQ